MSPESPRFPEVWLRISVTLSTVTKGIVMHKIISGGQTGADRAGLDAGLATGLSIGGWCPKGRLSEDGAIPAIYPLTETTTKDYRRRTLWNIRDSDATMIIISGKLGRGSKLTERYCRELGKPSLVVDVSQAVDVAAISDWLAGVEVLNVAGTRESNAPGLYTKALNLLVEVLRGDECREPEADYIVNMVCEITSPTRQPPPPTRQAFL